MLLAARLEAGQRPSVARSYKSRPCLWGGQACLICPWVSNNPLEEDRQIFLHPVVGVSLMDSIQRAGIWILGVFMTQITITWKRKEKIGKISF